MRHSPWPLPHHLAHCLEVHPQQMWSLAGTILYCPWQFSALNVFCLGVWYWNYLLVYINIHIKSSRIFHSVIVYWHCYTCMYVHMSHDVCHYTCTYLCSNHVINNLFWFYHRGQNWCIVVEWWTVSLYLPSDLSWTWRSRREGEHNISHNTYTSPMDSWKVKQNLFLKCKH